MIYVHNCIIFQNTLVCTNNILILLDIVIFAGDFGVPNNDPVRPRMANATDNEDHDHDDHDGHDHGGSGAIQIGATLASAVAFFAVLVI